VYKEIFYKAGMSLQDPLNKMVLPGHSGRHTNDYKQYVLDYLKSATNGLTGQEAKQALTNALTEIRNVLTKNPNMPYKGGM
jgi:hypothetical protein